MSAVATKTFILLLAQEEPLNFIQGTKISLQDVLSLGNRKEFHHIFPKAYLKSLEKYQDSQINCLANFSLLSRTDNNQIRNFPPSEYCSKMPADENTFQDILARHFCPPLEFKEANYENFLELRSELLFQKAKDLCEISSTH